MEQSEKMGEKSRQMERSGGEGGPPPDPCERKETNHLFCSPSRSPLLLMEPEWEEEEHEGCFGTSMQRKKMEEKPVARALEEKERKRR